MLYTLLQTFLKALFTLFFRARIIEKANLPLSGSVILAANHQSNWDPPLLAAFLERPVSYMAKKELFDVPVLGAIITSCHSFPVKRGAADRGAIKTALKVLKLQNCLGLFPEGTRSKDGRIHKAESGVALLAALSGAPVVPAAIIGTSHIFKLGSFFPQLSVVYGAPLRFEGNHKDKAALEEFSQRIMDAIEQMIQENS